jgi:hypothetical protein
MTERPDPGLDPVREALREHDENAEASAREREEGEREEGQRDEPERPADEPED